MEDRLKRGPFTLDELRQRGITPHTAVMRMDSSVWQEAGDVPELMELFTYSQQNAGQQFENVRNADDRYQQSGHRYSQQGNCQYGQQDCGWYRAGGNMPPLPKTYLVESILVTLFCCLPFGIVGIINASGVESAYFSGNYNEAVRKSMAAKKWTMWGLVSCLICWALYFFLYVVIFAGLGIFAAADL